MARTGPTVGGTPTYVVVSYKWIDANGTIDTTSYISTRARATDGNIEAMAVALGAASNANLYAVELSEVYSAATPSSASATEAPRESVKDVIDTLVRDSVSRKTQEVLIPAPLDAIFVTDTNVVDPSNALYQAVNTAADALLISTYGFISVRFSERKGTNAKLKF